MILWSVVLFVACKQNYLSRTPFSPILRLLLLEYGYCYVIVSFERFLLLLFFFLFFAGSGKFYWLSKFSTDYWLTV